MTQQSRWERLYRWYMKWKHDPCTGYLIITSTMERRRIDCDLWHHHEQWTGTKYRMHQSPSGVHKWSVL